MDLNNFTSLILPLFQKKICFRIFTFIKKIYEILVINTLFSVVSYFLQFLTNKILTNTIIFFEVYSLQLVYA